MDAAVVGAAAAAAAAGEAVVPGHVAGSSSVALVLQAAWQPHVDSQVDTVGEVGRRWWPVHTSQQRSNVRLQVPLQLWLRWTAGAVVQCPPITKLDSDVMSLGDQTLGFTPPAWTVVMTGLIGHSCGQSVS